MPESKQEGIPEDEERTRRVATISAMAPDREMPRASFPTHLDDKRSPASAELALMLRQISGYFGKHTRIDDFEALGFSLCHLFNRVDFLYRRALPALENWSERPQGDYNQEILQRQRTWLQLQTINRTLDRMAPLCHLLSDVIECLLDTLDNEENWLRTLDEEDTIMLEQVKTSRAREPEISGPPQLLVDESALHTEQWEHAINALMDQLLLWQEHHHKLVSFPAQFALPTSLEYNLANLDTAFAMLLDSAGAIFGDILPNFRLVRPADREEVGALLFDLMQQSDQMLVQFEIALDPFTRLIRYFALMSENG